MYSIASGMSLIREVINAHRILEEKNSVRILLNPYFVPKILCNRNNLALEL